MKKDLVLYYSKNNTTFETVEEIKKKSSNGIDIVNIAKQSIVDTSIYSRVLIGTGIYMGNIPGTVRKFISKNKNTLINNKIIFFIHGIISKDNYREILIQAIDGNLDENKVEVLYLGGKLDLKKQNFIIQQLLKQVAKQNNFDPYNANTIDNKKREELLKKFN